MIFSGELADKVLDGTKTQTRRPVVWSTPTIAYACRYQVGRTYAIQRKRGTHGVGPRIRVLDARMVDVFTISRDDAIAEGFTDEHAFLARWHEFYGTRFGHCWRIEFELVPA